MPHPEKLIISADLFQQALGYFQDFLAQNERLINDLNVYPVPDSDTGTNSLVTLKAGLAGMAGKTVAELAQTLSVNASKMALGNSGVILSAYLSGLAKELVDPVDTFVWQRALTSAAKAATESVVSPSQGTILSVANSVAIHVENSLGDQLLANSTAARIALAKTTDQLPELAKAGVVDSGAVVLTLFHDAFAKLISVEDFNELTINVPDCVVSEEYNGPIHELMFNVVLPLEQKNDLVGKLELLGDSISISPVETKNPQANKLRVHLHCDEPDRVISEIKFFGPVSDVVLVNLKLSKK